MNSCKIIAMQFISLLTSNKGIHVVETGERIAFSTDAGQQVLQELSKIRLVFKMAGWLILWNEWMNGWYCWKRF